MLITYITIIYLFVEPNQYQLFEVERKKPKKKQHKFTIMIIIFKYSTTNTRIEQLFRSRVQLATKQQLLYVIEAIKCYPQVDCQKKKCVFNIYFEWVLEPNVRKCDSVLHSRTL